MLGNYLAGIQQNTNLTNQALNTLIGAMNGLANNQVGQSSGIIGGVNQTTQAVNQSTAATNSAASQAHSDAGTTNTDLSGLQTSLTGIKSDLDTANTTGTAAKGDLDSLLSSSQSIYSAVSAISTNTSGTKTDLDNLLLAVDGTTSTSSLPSYDATAINDNSDIDNTVPTLGALPTKSTTMDQIAGDLTTFLNNQISSNPLTEVVAASGVDDTGGSSSVSASTSVGAVVLDFSQAGTLMSGLGVFWVSFCGLSGVVELIRG
jgi:hypothetical protein